MNKFDKSRPLKGLSFPRETLIKPVKGTTIMPVTKAGKPIKKGSKPKKGKGKGKDKPKKSKSVPKSRDIYLG